MPKQTLKNLQAQIDNLRKLRQGDYERIERQNAEIEKQKETIRRLAAEAEGLAMDKKWLKQVVQNLVPGDRNALTR